MTASATYDDLGRLSSVTDPDQGNHSYSYDQDGNVINDTSGTRSIGYNYDLLGRLGCVNDAASSSINASGSCTSGSNPYLQFTYDTDKLGTKGSTDFPVGRMTQSKATTYFPSGNQATTTEQMQYDARGRVIKERLLLSVPSGWEVASQLPSYYQMQPSYNDADQVQYVTTSTSTGGQGYTASNDYDSNTGVLIGVGNDTTQSPNLAKVLYNHNAGLDTIDYKTNSSGSGFLATEQFSYDADLRPTNASATWQSASGTSGAIFSQSPQYDLASNVISLSTTQASVPGQSSSGGSETQNFCYDEQNRLVWAGNSGTEPSAGSGTCGSAALSSSANLGSYHKSYSYTHLGQLWQVKGGGSQVQYLYCNSSAPHQLTAIVPTTGSCSNQSGATYSSSYDAWGNVTSGSNTATLSYDLLDHFVQWNAGSNKEWYVYDASGNRVLRRSINGSGTSVTVYAFGLEEHTYTFDGSGNPTGQTQTYYYRLGGSLLGALEVNGSTSTTNYFLSDSLGSVLATITNTVNSASVQGNQLYDPYGNSRYQSGSLNTSKGFTGQYNDNLTGLDYYGSRYYDPTAGVFLSADPIAGDLAGANPYEYVNANPETNIDPSGAMVACGAGCGGGSPMPPSDPPIQLPSAPYLLGGTGGGVNNGKSSPCGDPTNSWVSCAKLQLAAVTDLQMTVQVSTHLDLSSGNMLCHSTGGGPAVGPGYGFGVTLMMTPASTSCSPSGSSQTTGTTTVTVRGSGLAPLSACFSFLVNCSDEGAKDTSGSGEGKESGNWLAADTGEEGDVGNGPSVGGPDDEGGPEVVIDQKKFRYIFGEATGSTHNLERTNQLALQMKYLGVFDDATGQALLADHLQGAALDNTNVIGTYTRKWLGDGGLEEGNFVTKDSLFAGPSGKFGLFRSSWQITDEGDLNFVSLMILGGGK